MNNSGNGAMDRHLKRVERWLKRCVAACKCGSWTDALAEAECLEAETKGLREKLWDVVEEESLGTGKRGMVSSSLVVFKVTALALAIVLAAVMPISLDIEAGTGVYDAPAESIAFLTSTESDIINALRESLSSGNSGRVVLTVEIPEASPPAGEIGAAMASERLRARPARVAEEKLPPPAEPEKEDRRLSVDDVISLIQVGQRALRVPEPGVKVVPQ